MSRLRLLPVPVAVAVAAVALVLITWDASGQQFQHEAYVPLVARDHEPTPTPSRPVPPPPGPGYCGSSSAGPPAPGNAIFGLLTIGGLPAPAETLVTLTFNGKPGPSAYTLEAGGYRVDYAAGGQGHTPPCINEVGTELGLLVNGVHVASGVPVGPEAGVAFRFDVAVP